MNRIAVLVGLLLLAAGVLTLFTSSDAPLNIEQADTLIVISTNDGTTVRSESFKGEIVVSPDDDPKLEAISMQDGQSATFIQCDATLSGVKLEQQQCLRFLDQEGLNTTGVNASIVILEDEDWFDNESRAPDVFTTISCSALITNGKIKSTSCSRMDYPKGTFSVFQ